MTQTHKRGDVIVFSPDREVREALDAALRDERYRVVLASTAEEADLAARSASAEMALIDSQTGSSLDQMARLRKLNPALGFLLIIGAEETILAVEAARV